MFGRSIDVSIDVRFIRLKALSSIRWGHYGGFFVSWQRKWSKIGLNDVQYFMQFTPYCNNNQWSIYSRKNVLYQWSMLCSMNDWYILIDSKMQDFLKLLHYVISVKSGINYAISVKSFHWSGGLVGVVLVRRLGLPFGDFLGVHPEFFLPYRFYGL